MNQQFNFYFRFQMQISKLKILGNTLLLLACLWLLFFSIQFIQKIDTDELENYLPENSEIVLRIKSKTVIKRFLSDVLYKNNFDRKSISKFDIDQDPSTNKSFGINFEKNILFFYERRNNKDIVGVLAHLTDSDKFSQLNKEERTVAKTKENIGCLLFVLSPDKFDSTQLYNYCKELLNPNKNKAKATALLQKSHTENSVIDLYLSGNKNTILGDLLVQLKIEQNEINIAGKALRNPAIEKDSLSSFLIQPQQQNYLALQMGNLPDTLNYYLQSVLDKINLELPKIKSQHVLFYGLGVDNTSKNLAIQPYFDAVFRFTDTLSLSNRITELNTSDSLIRILSSDTLSIDNMNYFFKQLSSRDIYIGVTPKPDFYSVTQPQLFYLKGRPEAILTIKGDSWMADIAKAIPQIRNSKAFFEGVDVFEIEAKANDNFVVDVKGKIAFKSDELATLQLVQYFLSFIKAPTLEEN